MSANVDKVLAALDAGLQSSDEHGYPPRIDHPELCARCLAAHHVEDGDLCAPCRAWMLGDSDIDPTRRDEHEAVCCGCSLCRSGALREHDERDVNDAILTWMSAQARQHALVAHRRLLAELAERGIAHVCDSTCRGVYPQWRDDQERFHARGPVRIQRLDRDGNPTGEPQDLRGYVLHHVNGDSRDNRMENLRIMPASENPAPCPVQWRQQLSEDHWRIEYHGHTEVTGGHDAEATDPPPDWLRAGQRVPQPRRDWQADAFAYLRQIVAASRERLGL